MNKVELALQLKTLREAVRLLDIAEPDWSPADRERGEKTYVNLRCQIYALNRELRGREDEEARQRRIAMRQRWGRQA